MYRQDDILKFIYIFAEKFLKSMNDVASGLLRQANKKGISMTRLCRAAGTTPMWFEYLKHRVPKSIRIYLRMNEILQDENFNKKDI